MSFMQSPSGKRVIVTTSVFGRESDALERLKAAGMDLDLSLIGTAEETGLSERIAKLRACDGIIAGTEKFDRSLIASLDRLRVISRVGVGLDGIDFAALKDRSIEVLYTPDAVSLPVAELTVGLVIGLARRIHVADRGMHRRIWRRHVGPELRARTLGIVGLGRIGKLVARLFEPFGMTVIANDIAPDGEFARLHGISFVEKDELFRRSDFVTLHVPLTPMTERLMRRDVFGMMKPSAYLINTSRGPVVDEPDLLAALDAGVIAGAAIDVFGEEPYTGPLADREQVILTCHMGSCSDLGRKRMETEAAQNIIDFFSGKPVAGRVPDTLRV